MSLGMGQQNSQDRNNHLTGATITTLLTLIAVLTTGCAAQEPTDKPHVPQITHSPHEADASDIDRDGKGDELGWDGESGEVEGPGDGERQEIEPPEVPDEIYENTLEGAEAAARYYVRAFEYGYTTLDISPLEKICDLNSDTCSKHKQTITAIREEGSFYYGGRLKDKETEELYEVEDGVIVAFHVEQEHGEIRDRNGTVINSYDESEVLAKFLARYEGNHWKLRAISTER